MLETFMKNAQAYRQSRRDAKVFNKLICSSLLNVPGPGCTRFVNPVVTSSFTPYIRRCLSQTFIGRVIVSIINNLVSIDKHYHFDSLAEGHFDNGMHAKFFFDVKNVRASNICTLNYSISRACQAYCKTSCDNNWFAFRLNRTCNGGIPDRLDAFICVKAKEVLDNCSCISDDQEYLFSLREILAKCQSKFFVGMRKDLEKFKKYGSNRSLDLEFAYAQ